MKTLKEALMSRVTVRGPDDCWEWQAKSRHVFGYGQFVHGGIRYAAHRASYEVFNGPIPDGQSVMHKCDNPPCINPRHLKLGTALDNLTDAAGKGRMHPGEANGAARLTWKMVRDIRSKFYEHNCTCLDLAQTHKVSVAQIRNIVKGKCWKDAVDTLVNLDEYARRVALSYKGENNGNAALDRVTALKIRSIFRKGRGNPHNSPNLAKMFGVSEAVILRIVAGKIWE